MAEFVGIKKKKENDDLSAVRSQIHEAKEKYYMPWTKSNDLVQCRMERVRSEKYVAFYLYREDEEGRRKFALACTCDIEMEGPYLFHSDKAVHKPYESQYSANFLGSMSKNFLGTDFVIRDHRWQAYHLNKDYVSELGLILYETNLVGSAPNAMKAIIPRLNRMNSNCNRQFKPIHQRYATLQKRTKKRSVKSIQNIAKSLFPRTADYVTNTSSAHCAMKQNEVHKAQQRVFDSSRSNALVGDIFTSFENDTHLQISNLASVNEMNDLKASQHQAADDAMLYNALESEEDQLDLRAYQTQKPIWDRDIQGWALNFKGRAKLASKKNFILTVPAGSTHTSSILESENVYLRLGKMAKDDFALDFRDPFSPLVALGIAVSTFAHKRLVV